MAATGPDTEFETLRRLQYAAAIACGVLAALTVHILLTVSGIGLGTVLGENPSSAQQLTASLAWWAIGAAGFIAGWATGAYLATASRGRAFIATIARRLLAALVLAMCTAAGVLSKSGAVGASADVISSLAALLLGSLSAFCGARLAYLSVRDRR